MTAHGRCPEHSGTGLSEALTKCPVGTRTECELFRSVFMLHTLLMRITDKLAAPIGLTGSRWLLLSAVAWGDEPPTAAELSRRCILSIQNVSRMLGALEAEELIERVEAAGRAQRVRLTHHGREVLEGTAHVAQQLRDGFLAGLSPGKVDTLGNDLGALVENLQRMEQELVAEGAGHQA